MWRGCPCLRGEDILLMVIRYPFIQESRPFVCGVYLKFQEIKGKKYQWGQNELLTCSLERCTAPVLRKQGQLWMGEKNFSSEEHMVGGNTEAGMSSFCSYNFKDLKKSFHLYVPSVLTIFVHSESSGFPGDRFDGLHTLRGLLPWNFSSDFSPICLKCYSGSRHLPP